MFFTRDDAEIRLPFPAVGKDEHYWSSVQIFLHIPWFLISYEAVSDDLAHKVQSAVLVMHLLDVIEISNTVKIVQILLVSPGHLNGSGGWEAATVSEVWVGSEPGLDENETATVYVTANGVRNVVSVLETAEADLLSVRRVL